MTVREWEFLGGALDGSHAATTTSRLAATTGLTEREVEEAIGSLARQGFFKEASRERDAD